MADPFFLVVALVVALLIVWVIRLEIRLHRLTQGSDGKSLEATIGNTMSRIASLESAHKDILATIAHIEGRLAHSVQTVRTIRFDPFEGTAGSGKQSFATAFLDEHGDGVVVSSLYTREKVSVFAKPVEKFASTYELTKEEKEAIGGKAS